MEKEKTELKGARELRRKAEERLKEKPAVSEKMSELETQELVQELRVYQTELEMQNEELRRTQAVLEESRAKYSDLYDFAPVGYLTLNRQGLILEANLTACSKLGKERSLLISINNLFTNFIIEKGEKDLFYQHLGKVFEAKSLETCELELKGKGNTKFYAQLESIMVKDNLSQCRTAITDITERIRAEMELRRSQTELQTANLKLGELLRVKDSFIANVSHELRTPVTVIKEGVSLLLDGVTGPLGEQQIKYLRLVDRNCQRLTEFVSNILDLSKINAGRMRLLRGKIKLWGLVEEVLKESQAMTGKRILKIEGAGVREVLGDTGKIRQVLTNFLSNAVKFTKDDGSITFSIKEEREFVTVTVLDDGVGITKEDLPKLFQEFSQVGEYKAGGTGLGLALCKNIIEQHKGTISVVSNIGKGTTFTFTLPFYTSGLFLEESFKDLVEESAKHSGSSMVALIAVDCEALIQLKTLEATRHSSASSDVPRVETPPRGLEATRHSSASSDVPRVETPRGLDELEKLLRPQIKNGDLVLGFEPKWLILLAVADMRGVLAISKRIRRTFGGASLAIGSAFYPLDGTDAHKLFSIAQDFARPVPLEKIKKKRILLAEDEPSVLEVTKLRLEQFGFDVLTATNGEEVLSYFKDHEAPDLLLMDMKMPKLDGFGLAAKLKVMPRAQKVPIVAFTAYGEELKEKCLEVGILHIVNKPYGAGELLDKLHQALEATRPSSASSDVPRVETPRGLGEKEPL